MSLGLSLSSLYVTASNPEILLCTLGLSSAKQGRHLEVEADIFALLVIRYSPGQGVQLVNGQGAVIHLHQSCLHAHSVQLSIQYSAVFAQTSCLCNVRPLPPLNPQVSNIRLLLVQATATEPALHLACSA